MFLFILVSIAVGACAYMNKQAWACIKRENLKECERLRGIVLRNRRSL